MVLKICETHSFFFFLVFPCLNIVTIQGKVYIVIPGCNISVFAITHPSQSSEAPPPMRNFRLTIGCGCRVLMSHWIEILALQHVYYPQQCSHSLHQLSFHQTGPYVINPWTEQKFQYLRGLERLKSRLY